MTKFNFSGEPFTTQQARLVKILKDVYRQQQQDTHKQEYTQAVARSLALAKKRLLASMRDVVKISGIRWKCETRALYFSEVKVFEAITQNGQSTNHYKITKNEQAFHTRTHQIKWKKNTIKHGVSRSLWEYVRVCMLHFYLTAIYPPSFLCTSLLQDPKTRASMPAVRIRYFSTLEKKT